MPSQISKVKQMKKNVELCTVRTVRDYERAYKRELSQKEKQNIRSDYEQRARKLDKEKLHEVWND